jgi:hypothetical protein
MNKAYVLLFLIAVSTKSLGQDTSHTLFQPVKVEGSFYYQSQGITSHGDIDGNGFTDIITKNQLYLFDGHKFVISSNFPLSGLNLGEVKKANSLLVDIDFDADLDLIYAQNEADDSENHSGLYLNNDGEFSMKASALIEFISHQNYQLLKFDFDNDGKEDIIAIGEVDSRILLQKTNDWEMVLIDGIGAPMSSHLNAFDLDNDGDLDLISTQGDVVALFNTGSSIEKQSLDFPHGSKYLLADFNQDGQFEVATIKSGLVVIHRYIENNWVEERGGSSNVYVTIDEIDDFQLDDLNGDGKIEIISALRLGDMYSVPNTELWVQTVDSEFNETYVPRFEANDFYYVLDLNNDGYKEVISIDKSEDLDFQNYSSTLIFQNQNGVLSRAFGFGFHKFLYSQEYIQPSFSNSSRPRINFSYLLGDFNNDNQPDFISYGTSDISLYLSSNFEFHDPIKIETSPIYYLAVDKYDATKINSVQFENSTLKFIQYQLTENNIVESMNIVIPKSIPNNEITSLKFHTVDLHGDNTSDYLISLNLPIGTGQVSNVGESFIIESVAGIYEVKKNKLPLTHKALEADFTGDGKSDIYFGTMGPNQDGWNNKFKYFLILNETGNYDTLINIDQSITNGVESMYLEDEGKDLLVFGDKAYTLSDGALIAFETSLDLSWSYSSTLIDFDQDGDFDRIQYKRQKFFGQPFNPLDSLSFAFWWNVNGIFVKDERTTPKIIVGDDPSTFLEIKSLSNTMVFFKRRGLHQFVSQNEPIGVGVVTSIDEKQNTKSIQAYPNPVTSQINIHSQHLTPPINWTILNTNGTILGSDTVLKNEFTIDTGVFPSGIYILRLESNGIYESLKFIKSN